MKSLISQARYFAKIMAGRFPKRLVSIVLFGSVARGQAKPDSDIDILVVMKGLPVGRFARRDILEPVWEELAEKGCDANINCHIRTPAEAEKISLFYYDFPGEATVLFDTRQFFGKIIKEVAGHIKKTGAVREKWGKFHYWDLKPGAHADEEFEIL